MHLFQFNFNQKVKDKVTGFEGIVLGRIEYATGCLQYGVCPSKLTSDGKVPDWYWFDGGRLVLVNDNDVNVEKETGGPHPPVLVSWSDVQGKELLSTKEFASQFSVSTQTVLRGYCVNGHYMGHKPMKLPNNRLLWTKLGTKSDKS